MRHFAVLVAYSHDRMLHQDRITTRIELLRERFPHLAWPALRVLESINQGFYVAGLARKNGVTNCGQQRETLDALRRPFGAYCGARHSPDFFRVRLKENLIKAATKAI